MQQLYILLRPFSWLYGIILKLRHRFYDKGIFRTSAGPLPTIVVGNLELGGTGKSPLTDHILSLLSSEMKMGLLSRGYGRKSSGYVCIGPASTPDEVGDEPLMLSLSNPEVQAAVCENRLLGLERLNKESDVELVVLDDAFQHRPLRSGFNVLVTPYQRPFWKNQLVPEGKLRDIKQRARHAHAVVVSKCPVHLSEEEQSTMKKELEWYSTAPIHFARIIYSSPHALFATDSQFEDHDGFILFTGLANPEPLVDHLKSQGELLRHIPFKDHHPYSLSDAQKLKEIYSNFAGRKIALVTTAKDAVKLKGAEMEEALKGLPIFIIPIHVEFLSEGFDKMIKAYARANKRNG